MSDKDQEAKTNEETTDCTAGQPATDEQPAADEGTKEATPCRPRGQNVPPPEPGEYPFKTLYEDEKFKIEAMNVRQGGVLIREEVIGGSSSIAYMERGQLSDTKPYELRGEH